MDVERLLVDNMAWIRMRSRRYYRDADDADDLAGETIEKILRNKDQFDSSRSFRPWVLTVMVNTYISQYNRRNRMHCAYAAEDCSLPSPMTADQGLTISCIFSVVRECARRSVAIECVVMYAKGYSYGEISKILGIPIGTVMSRISNGRKILREALGG